MPEAVSLDEAKQRVLTWAEGLVAAMGLDAVARIGRDEGDAITVAIDGPGARDLIGRRAECLDALQLLATMSCLRPINSRLYVLFDADSYRAKREQMLIRMALELADEVDATGQEAELEPLSPLERRVIHRALQERPTVRTYSEGDEPRRYIVIAPAE